MAGLHSDRRSNGLFSCLLEPIISAMNSHCRVRAVGQDLA